MAKVTLGFIIRGWVKDLGTPLYFDGVRINHPCDCGKGHWTYARLEENNVVLPRTGCKCKNCCEKSINMADPKAFTILERALKARMKHKSVVLNDEIWDADELMHAVHHRPNGGKLDIRGTIDGASIDAAKYDINVSDGAIITNSHFDNIMKPITVSGTVSFIGNTFYAAKDQPPTATFDVHI
jgi:hypothetical protein